MTPIILCLTYFPLYSWPEYSDCVSRHICWMFYLILNRLRGNMCEFIEDPEWRSGDSDSQAVRYSWSLRHGCSPTAQMFIMQTWLPLHLLCYLLRSLQPPRRTLQLCKAKAAPTPFPLEDTGSLPRHGNDVIERKK